MYIYIFICIHREITHVTGGTRHKGDGRYTSQGRRRNMSQGRCQLHVARTITKHVARAMVKHYNLKKKKNGRRKTFALRVTEHTHVVAIFISEHVTMRWCKGGCHHGQRRPFQKLRFPRVSNSNSIARDQIIRVCIKNSKICIFFIQICS